jgi:hypothetical protein
MVGHEKGLRFIVEDATGEDKGMATNNNGFRVELK